MREVDVTLDKCKACDARTAYYKVVEDDVGVFIGFTVSCIRCKLATPVFKKEFEAMCAWNKMQRFEVV
jgi:hypothetical protein